MRKEIKRKIKPFLLSVFLEKQEEKPRKVKPPSFIFSDRGEVALDGVKYQPNTTPSLSERLIGRWREKTRAQRTEKEREKERGERQRKVKDERGERQVRKRAKLSNFFVAGESRRDS